jgi:hypothetical protein
MIVFCLAISQKALRNIFECLPSLLVTKIVFTSEIIHRTVLMPKHCVKYWSLFCVCEYFLMKHGHVSSQNNWYLNSVNSHFIHEVPLCDVKAGMWCSVNAKRTTGSIFCAETILIGV